MTIQVKARLIKLEKLMQSKRQELPCWQVLQPDGGALLRYTDGRVIAVSDPIPGVKAYQDISPDDWDKPKDGHP